MSRTRYLLALLGLGALVVAMVCLDSSPVQATAPSQTFDTPGAHSFVVPDGVTSVTVEALGAAGGTAHEEGSGGLGGRATATISVTPGETLQINVGGAGGGGTSHAGGVGGVNGGGAGGLGVGGGGGGGASDVRRGGTGLTDRVVVAGGGGGGGGNYGCEVIDGGDGGSTPSAGSAATSLANGRGGAPGSAVAGGTGGAAGDDGDGSTGSPGSDGGAGTGGEGASGTDVDELAAGGGGGGWFGGGGGGSGPTYWQSGGGGGGSSYADSSATSVTFEDGVNSAGGSVTLTWVAAAPTTTTTTTTTTAPPTTTTPAGPSAAYGSTPGQGETARTVAAGAGLTVNSSGWYPGSTVIATMHSTPVRLGQVVVDANGAFVTEFAVPASAVNGAHRLELTGTGANGAPAVVNLAITVTGGIAEASAPAALSFVC